MLDEDDTLFLCFELHHKLRHFVDSEVGESRTGFVKHNKFRLSNKHTGDLKPTEIAKRHIARPFIPQLDQSSLCQHSLRLIHYLLGVAFAEVGAHSGVLVHTGSGNYVVENRQIRQRFGNLEGAGNAHARHLVRRKALHLLPLENDLAVGWLINAANGIEQRSLTRAVRADDAEGLSLINGEIQSVNSLETAEVHLQPFNTH